MSLQNELHFRNPIRLLPHEVLLSIYHTSACIKKEADRFFKTYGVTDIQFNLMMILSHQTNPDGGLTQAQISDMMLVNRANITALIDRMEKGGLVVRAADPIDRRFNIIKLTEFGQQLLAKVEPEYDNEIIRRMSVFTESEMGELIRLNEKVRKSVLIK